MERRKRRKNNVMWRGIEREGTKEKKWIMEMMDKILGRDVGVRNVRKGQGRVDTWVLIVELESEEDKKELLKKKKEVRRWGVERYR